MLCNRPPRVFCFLDVEAFLFVAGFVAGFFFDFLAPVFLDRVCGAISLSDSTLDSSSSDDVSDLFFAFDFVAGDVCAIFLALRTVRLGVAGATLFFLFVASLVLRLLIRVVTISEFSKSQEHAPPKSQGHNS